MDFRLRYTPEQEEFRKEVRDWIAANKPHEDDWRQDAEDQTVEEFEASWGFQRKLGEKGWRAPGWPKEYGGGGFSPDQVMIIQEELARNPVRHNHQDLGVSLCAPAVFIWGTEEQKQRILPPILRGEKLTWQLYTEPEAGSDLASLKTTAIREGDEFVINGTKMWVGHKHRADHFYLLAVTDPTAPRHANLGAFYIPADLPGITISVLDLVCFFKTKVTFENVRVPASTLIAGETDGWRVTQSTLEVEHGGRGSLEYRWGELIQTLIDYCKEIVRDGRPLIEDPAIGEKLADLYVESQIGRLFAVRNYWMRTAGVRGTYEGSQAALHHKELGPEIAKTILEIVGPYALINDRRWAPLFGRFEVNQRFSLDTHSGGTPEVQRLIMARRLGTGKAPQPAAPMPTV